MKRAEKKNHLVDVAISLFNRCGYHAAGVDQIIAEAGIAKTTLYRHFESKELLIATALRRIDAQFREDLRRAVERAAEDPAARLLASFDFLEAWFRSETFYGCPFISAAGEYGDSSDPIFREVVLHKRLVLAYFEELARAAELANPVDVAHEINLLHEGAIAVAHVTRDPGVAQRARSVASKLLAA